MAEPTVAAGYARSLVDVAVARGADRAALLARAAIDDVSLAHSEARLGFSRFKALMHAAKDLTSDAAFALHFGAESRLKDISVVGLIAHASATMGEAFEQTNRFARLVIEVEEQGNGPRFAIVRRADGVWIEDRRRNPNAFPELTESTWARFVGDVARNFPNRPYVRAVHVTHAAPDYVDVYRAVLKAPVTFSSSWNALQIDPAWLDIRLAPANRYVFGIFSERAEALLKSLEAETGIASRIEALLIPILHTGDLRMERIARAIGVSRPTLYRQLKAEGTRFDVLVDHLRHRMAQHYLDGQKVSLSETAYLTGFSDPAAFSRAYKRWTGRRPGRRSRNG